MTRVVHLKRKGGIEVEGCDIYIGRAIRMAGWNLPTSKWSNPFRLKDYGNDRQKVLDIYEAHVRAKPELMASLGELEGKVLGCWCAPLPCHGDVLIKLLAETKK